MALSQQAKYIICELPLEDTLHGIQHRLRYSDDANPRQQDVASLLMALLGSEAAISFSSPSGSGTVAYKLLIIRSHVRKGLVGLGHFRSLVRHVVSKSSDIDIWEEVFNIINNLSDLTPPASSIAPTFKGTLVKPSSIRLSDNDNEKRYVVEKELFFEIKDCTFRNVGGFCDKFFDTRIWDIEQKEMLQAVMAEHDGNRWKGFASAPKPNEQLVWDWLRSLEDRALSGAQHTLYTTRKAHQFKECENQDQMDLFFRMPAPEANSIFQYKHVLVVGQQKSSYDTSRFKADFLRLTRLVKGVFIDQPMRRFVHAFTLCASIMELWVFDRSGAYSSGPFDIHDKPDIFARALVSYATMDDNAIGLDMIIEREDKHRYVTLNDAVDKETVGKEMRIKLAGPMVRQKAIVCRGTTCYETQDNSVAKFSWASDKHKLEVEQLKLARDQGVKGVARIVAHRHITTIAELRKGLEFRERYKFRNEEVYFEDLSSAGTRDTSSVGPKDMPGHKRKSLSDHQSYTSGSKKRRLNSQQSKLVQKQSGELVIAKGRPGLYSASEDKWENRIYSCLVISPAGRVISDFRTIKELLEAIRDAVKGHQSLYETGHILHRDISSNNIIITKPEVADGFKGMLIDLDLAKVRDSGETRHRTGTTQFMAVEVLRKTDHTYRHDLESFFYVLLWMCARQSWRNGFARGEKRLKESMLRKWEIGSFDSIADSKQGHMGNSDTLKIIMAEFPRSLDIVKPLCLRIREILFSRDKNDGMNIGTPAGDANQLYSPIIAAFNDAVKDM